MNNVNGEANMNNELESSMTQAAEESAEKISLIGSEGSGKTCFLAGLRWISSPGEDAPFGVTGQNLDSQKFLVDLHNALKLGHCPPPSHALKILDMNISYREEMFNARVIDCAGEEFKTAANLKDDKHPIIRNLLESTYLLVCLDVECDVKNPDNHSDRLEALFTILHAHLGKFRQKKCALLLTKADLTGIPREQWTYDLARKYLEENNRSLAQKIDNLGLDVRVYFVSSLGSTMQNGERPDPYGYEAVFDWLGKKKKEVGVEGFVRKNKRPLSLVGGVLTAAILLLGGWAGIHYWRVSNARSVLHSDDATSAEKIEAIGILPPEERNEELKRIYEDLKAKQTETLSIASLRDLYKSVDEYLRNVEVSDARRIEFEELKKQIADALEDQHISEMKTHKERIDKDAFLKAELAYKQDEYSAKKRVREVSELKTRVDVGTEKMEKRRISAQIVDCRISNRATLNAKMKAVSDFAAKHASPQDAEEMRQAVKDMGTVLSNKRYTLKFEQGGKLENKELGSYLRVKFGDRDYEGKFKVPDNGEYVPGAEPAWGWEIETVWKVGDKIKIEWKCKQWWWVSPFLYASIELDGDCFALLKLLASKCVLNAKNPCDFVDDPYLKVRCDDFRDADASMERIQKYLVPGTYWWE